mmetsp:Transcript_72336/g.182456  ORF Transcript_72336/g.182456 Transcript_72336/m.182456 type:complete len:135 (+) Transcript_72336:140-544(+)
MYAFLVMISRSHGHFCSSYTVPESGAMPLAQTPGVFFSMDHGKARAQNASSSWPHNAPARACGLLSPQSSGRLWGMHSNTGRLTRLVFTQPALVLVASASGLQLQQILGCSRHWCRYVEPSHYRFHTMLVLVLC